MAFSPQFTTSKKLQGMFTIPLFLSLFISIGALVLLEFALKADRLIIEDDWQDTLEIVKLKGDAEASESNYRGYLLSGEKEFLERFNESENRFKKELDNLLSTSTTQEEHKVLLNLKELHEKEHIQIKLAMELKDSHTPIKKIETYFEDKIMPLRTNTRTQLDLLQKQKENELVVTKESVAIKSQRTYWIILVATSLSLCLIVIISVLLSRRLSQLYALSIKSAEELQVSVNNLQQVNSNLGQFAAIAAHDLKSPLRTVSLYVQMLSTELKNGQKTNVEDVMGSIVESTKKMRGLVDDLLSYSVAENMEFKPQETPFNSVVESVKTSLQADIEETSAKIEYDSLPVVFAESKSLYALLLNLVSNAIKYKSNKAPVVKISALESEKDWTISIADNGIGFKMTQVENIFRPFKRLEENQNVLGTGLGLAICKKIIERHKGKIWAVSTPGEGSIFSFSIPKPEFS